jgi:pyruvate kinase
MTIKVLATLGPSSLNSKTIKEMTAKGVSLFRINLSHTKLEDVEGIVKKIQSWTDVPVCLDSEGAQIRNQDMVSESVSFEEGDTVTIHHKPVLGDNKNISFTPSNVTQQLQVGDKIRVDFNSVCFTVTKKEKDYLMATVIEGGCVGSNKAADTDGSILLDPITPKDKEAFKIGLKLGVKDFSLSFTNSLNDVNQLRKIIGYDVNLISKIESIKGVLNLGEILPAVDQILIDRGDLSREMDIEKIPFIQRRIIANAKSKNTPVYVATNLLESMVYYHLPTRAELNDIASTLLMGADGLVLAAETAIGKYPVKTVEMVNAVIDQFNRWTPESSSEDIIFN